MLVKSISEKMLKKPRDCIVFDDQELEFVKGQRGKDLLVIDGYTFARNNTVENAIYWCCRHRNGNRAPCRARVRTLQKKNGLHTITITQPDHNHQPTHRMLRKLNVFCADGTDVFEENLNYSVLDS